MQMCRHRCHVCQLRRRSIRSAHLLLRGRRSSVIFAQPRCDGGASGHAPVGLLGVGSPTHSGQLLVAPNSGIVFGNSTTFQRGIATPDACHINADHKTDSAVLTAGSTVLSTSTMEEVPRIQRDMYDRQADPRRCRHQPGHRQRRISLDAWRFVRHRPDRPQRRPSAMRSRTGTFHRQRRNVYQSR